VNTFDDLVHTGVLVERDLAEERAFWKRRQAEQSSRMAKIGTAEDSPEVTVWH